MTFNTKPIRPKVIHLIAARSGTGKTTLAEKLIPVLVSRGLRVAALKGNSHHHKLDIPGKDSWRFRQAGANVSGIISSNEYILMGSASSLEEGHAAAIGLLSDFDLIIIEGNKNGSNPKIEVIREEVSTEPTNAPHVIAYVSDTNNLPFTGKNNIPVIDLNHIPVIADFIIKSLELNHIINNKSKEPNGHNQNIQTNNALNTTTNSVHENDPLTHFDGAGRPRMVDVSAKEQSMREAYARGEIFMEPATLERIRSGTITKGDVLGVAQVAAIMAVKDTGRIIPMAHPLPISGAEADFNLIDEEGKCRIEIGVRVRLTGQTGVEMEALTGVSVAALTIYDMCKAIDKNMVIGNIRLEEKKGGRSGHYRREEENDKK